jgi:hypothetical protein
MFVIVTPFFNLLSRVLKTFVDVFALVACHSPFDCVPRSCFLLVCRAEACVHLQGDTQGDTHSYTLPTTSNGQHHVVKEPEALFVIDDAFSSHACVQATFSGVSRHYFLNPSCKFVPSSRHALLSSSFMIRIRNDSNS